MDGWEIGWKDGRMEGWTDGWMDGVCMIVGVSLCVCREHMIMCLFFLNAPRREGRRGALYL